MYTRYSEAIETTPRTSTPKRELPTMEKTTHTYGTTHGNDLTTDEEHTTGQSQINSQGTDDLLDEIDGLLESNAEEFVRSYVQKGGQ